MNPALSDYCAEFELYKQGLAKRNRELKNTRRVERMSQLHSLMPKELRAATELKQGRHYTIQVPISRAQ